MPKYYVKLRVDYAGEIEAADLADAEMKAWGAWGDTMDNEITYDGIYDIKVEEIEDDEEDEEDDE